jgi:hypothetical protein
MLDGRFQTCPLTLLVACRFSSFNVEKYFFLVYNKKAWQKKTE